MTSNCRMAAKPTRKEVELARWLVEGLTEDFDPGEYQDEYRASVMDLIERKAEGKKPKKKRAAREETGDLPRRSKSRPRRQGSRSDAATTLEGDDFVRPGQRAGRDVVGDPGPATSGSVKSTWKTTRRSGTCATAPKKANRSIPRKSVVPTNSMTAAPVRITDEELEVFGTGEDTDHRDRIFSPRAPRSNRSALTGRTT